MNRNVLQILMFSMAVLVAFAVLCEVDLAGDHRASAQDDATVVENGSGGAYTARGPYRASTADQMFYNYYVPPCGYPMTRAQLYLATRATPPLVGHVWHATFWVTLY